MLLLVMLTGIHSSLVIVTVSRVWNSVIEENYQACRRNRIRFIWIKHTESADDGIILSLQKNEIGLCVLEVQCNAAYMEVFLFKALFYLDLDSWILLVASDELISNHSINLIILELNDLNENITYGINRLWVKFIGKNYYYSLIPTAPDSKCDHQYRLFKIKNLKEDRNIHSPGFKFKRRSNLDSGISLIHLIWEMESLEDRISKIKKYDEVSMGAGRGKLRYYLPEIFQDKEHFWTKLSENDHVDLMKWREITSG